MNIFTPRDHIKINDFNDLATRSSKTTCKYCNIVCSGFVNFTAYRELIDFIFNLRQAFELLLASCPWRKNNIDKVELIVRVA